MRIVRIISYEGTPERLLCQLAQSQPDGSIDHGNKITISILTLPSTFGVWRFLTYIFRLFKS